MQMVIQVLQAKLSRCEGAATSALEDASKYEKDAVEARRRAAEWASEIQELRSAITTLQEVPTNLPVSRSDTDQDAQ